MFERLSASKRVRRWRRAARRPTAALGSRPDFLIIGAQKAGTTSLWEYLLAHPDVVGGFEKELHYFDRNHDRGERWYRAQFPLEARVRGGRITGEATPYYLFHPLVPDRVATLLPDIRLVVLLRDPIERAFSHHRMQVRVGVEPLSFLDAIEAEEARLAPGWEAVARGVDPDKAFQRYSYVARGHYADQLERWYERFDPSRVHVDRAEDLFDDPAAVYGRVLGFLGLGVPERLPEFGVHNAGPGGSEVPADARSVLAAHYADHDRRLRPLTGISYAGD